MKEYDLEALTWIHTWTIAALVEKNDLDNRIHLLQIHLLQKCLENWIEERKELANDPGE